MKRVWLALLLSLVAGAGVVRADQTTATVQQALKDQGFFYGEANGQKTADTTAAIRRYQIRNGLQITGEIDAETLRSLGIGSATARVAPAPPPAATSAETPAEGEDAAGQSALVPTERARDPGSSGTQPRGLPPEMSGVFAGTPYEMAPPDVQRHVIVGAQALLARAGYYRSGIDGEYGPGTAAAVRAYQSRAGLAPSGRLNMETLAALELLPGQHAPSGRRRFPSRPIYRGQWIPE